MDINFLRIGLTLAAFGAFLGIVWWAYAPSRKARFERDSRIVFDDERSPGERKTR